MKIDLTKRPNDELLRATPARGTKSIDPQGGDFGAGLIRGAAILTRGEALGHRMWVDSEMLDQTHAAITAAGERGIKSRFTHPGMSSDGLGSHLGRIKSSTRDGDVVRADIHLAQSAHDTPDGDLAGYVMRLAQEDAAAFGTSIVFRRDRDGEKLYEATHTTNGKFTSPDPSNTNHYPHARIKSLRAADVVDEPAANPSGLFHSNQIPLEAEALLTYALGLSAECPELTALSVDADRATGFVHRFFERHGLELHKKEPTPMPAELTAPQQAKHYLDTFGAQGAVWFAEGKTFAECETLHKAAQDKARADELAAKDASIVALTKERDDLALRIKQAKLGEKPLDFSAADKAGEKKTFASLFRLQGQPKAA